MLITTNPQRTLWETILPPGYQDLPRELAAVHALLDDPAFFEPSRAHFCPLGVGSGSTSGRWRPPTTVTTPPKS
jgi:hypothetical protein